MATGRESKDQISEMIFLSPELQRKPRTLGSGLVQPEKSLGTHTHILNIRSLYKLCPFILHT